MDTETRKPRRRQRNILPQFADKILSGEKTTTIRPDAKNMQAGDLISFWVGWRKKNPIYICTAEIVDTPIEIAIGEKRVIIDGAWDYEIDGDLNELAKSDGFPSFAEMISFFQTTYPPKKNREWSFEGKLITFGNIRVEIDRYPKK